MHSLPCHDRIGDTQSTKKRRNLDAPSPEHRLLGPGHRCPSVIWHTGHSSPAQLPPAGTSCHIPCDRVTKEPLMRLQGSHLRRHEVSMLSRSMEKPFPGAGTPRVSLSMGHWGRWVQPARLIKGCSTQPWGCADGREFLHPARAKQRRNLLLFIFALICIFLKCLISRAS